MSKLWKKGDHKLHPLIEKYTVGSDFRLDIEIFSFDIKASLAHAKGLEKINILTKKELLRTKEALSELEKDFETGKIKIKIEDEDCHTVIENYLVKKIGETGKKIHTGRSRNDQVLVATRLYMKDSISEIKSKGICLTEKFLELAEKYKGVAMPGYSHTQQAMLSSTGHYFASMTESILDDLELLDQVYKHIDKNPLGSAAGFGVSFPLDREFTTKNMGFDKIQINSLYCQNSRGKFESVLLEGITQVMFTLGKFANDFILFTSKEFDFFEINPNLLTGSSIMPQKKNPDALEILRANVSVVISNQETIKNISKNILSGYNRDLQLIKKPLIESINIVKDSLDIISLYVENLKPKVNNMEDRINKEIFAADIANDLVKKKNIPFREAYKKALGELKNYKTDYSKNIESKISLGAPGNLGLKHYRKKLKKIV